MSKLFKELFNERVATNNAATNPRNLTITEYNAKDMKKFKSTVPKI